MQRLLDRTDKSQIAEKSLGKNGLHGWILTTVSGLICSIFYATFKRLALIFKNAF